ncbi:condensation domain-containing protein [Pseudorhodoferax sp. Leaf274]|uniref:condensation domain-containing protein n=1 Tax=Pseudorhodoferax sp. Leaf274 TaxID=1736318 RepID=UPI0012E18B1A|nr:condensation domain-containing protein [Pseudorhodoferax sp. Leaf274]
MNSKKTPDVSVMEVFIASKSKQQLFYFQAANPNSSAYNMWLELPVAEYGDIGDSAIERAFSTLCRKHSSLRTAFEIKNGQLMEHVYAEIAMEILHSPQQNKNEISEFLAKPFILTTPGLFRALNLKDENGKSSAIVFSAHHIVCDGVSLA